MAEARQRAERAEGEVARLGARLDYELAHRGGAVAVQVERGVAAGLAALSAGQAACQVFCTACGPHGATAGNRNPRPPARRGSRR